MTTPQLYLISPPSLSDLDAFAQTLEETLQAGSIACFQLRLKNTEEAIIRKAVAQLMPLVHAHDVAFVLNDRPDLAKELGCDGVHIGQDDTSYKDARALLGKEAIIGVTCHASKHLAMIAGEQGADYVAFGAFFGTQTKEAKTTADPWILEWWTTLFETPCVAIGGITPDNAAPLMEAGADFLAISGGIWHHPDGPAAAVKAFHNLILDKTAEIQ